jgi:hypothetical protein
MIERIGPLPKENEPRRDDDGRPPRKSGTGVRIRGPRSERNGPSLDENGKPPKNDGPMPRGNETLLDENGTPPRNSGPFPRESGGPVTSSVPESSRVDEERTMQAEKKEIRAELLDELLSGVKIHDEILHE